VYVQNDRSGIYALGYPAIDAAAHLTSLAELIGLASAAGLALVLLLAAGRRISGGGSSARALLGEFRTSFYRKLFLAFVLASVVPVLTLASFTRAYLASRFRADVELAAARTTSIAQRFIDEGGAAGLFADAGPMAVTSYDDDVLVWVSRVLDQDINIFDGPRLVATSKRDLFASGLLPMRTPADVYRAVVLERRTSFIGTEQAGRFQYLLAAAPVGSGERRAVITVPLTSRQREIEREIAELDRRIVVAALLFIVFGAVIGYMMAERIADPVSRLTRAARRIARGDLDARTALTSADELGRLVEAFNNMAADLQRQRAQLERTNRLEAWAEMARQVAHEIKNPLTPIQLSTEHMRRVHADRGRPLAPVLDECTETILTQVRLLRQIAGEFSSFASSPTARPVVTSPVDLIQEVVAPYRPGLPARLALEVDLPSELPHVSVDRSLVGRALTNVIDNALHAMPGAGTLRVHASADGPWVRVVIADSGVGMDDQALRRVFEPSFSTKATGTGLGLAIARRNIELCGGSISLESRQHEGTTVTVRLPVAHVPPAADQPDPEGS
jgi:signal transduction histidine kinase